MTTLPEILERNLKHYDTGELGDDHTDMIVVTVAAISALVKDCIPEKRKNGFMGVSDQNIAGYNKALDQIRHNLREAGVL